jgi:hypothetical protein
MQANATDVLSLKRKLIVTWRLTNTMQIATDTGPGYGFNIIDERGGPDLLFMRRGMTPKPQRSMLSHSLRRQYWCKDMPVPVADTPCKYQRHHLGGLVTTPHRAGCT